MKRQKIPSSTPQYSKEPSDWISWAPSFKTTASLNHTPLCQGGVRSEIELIDSGGGLTDNIGRVTLTLTAAVANRLSAHCLPAGISDLAQG